jgi:hypothetical protein
MSELKCVAAVGGYRTGVSKPYGTLLNEPAF